MEFIIKSDEQEKGNTVRTFTISKYSEDCREAPKQIKRTKPKAWGGLSCSQTILGFRILHCIMPSIYKRKNEAHKRRGEECFCCVEYMTVQHMIPDRGKPALPSYALEIVWCFGWRETGTCLPTHVPVRAHSLLLENKLHTSKECTKQGVVWACASSFFFSSFFLEIILWTWKACQMKIALRDIFEQKVLLLKNQHL